MQIALIYPPHTETVSLYQSLIQRAGMDYFDNGLGHSEPLQNCDAFLLLHPERVFELMAATQLIDVLKQQVILGKPLLSLGSAAQLLVETGLLPGLENNKPAIQFAEQIRPPRDAVTFHLIEHYQYNAFTRYLKWPLSVTVADWAWQFRIPVGLRMELDIQGLTLFQDDGQAVCGLANKAGNVMAILPPIENTILVDLLFNSLHEHLKEGYKPHVRPLFYYPR